MSTRYQVWLDGLPMHGLDPAIIVTDIMEETASMDVVTHPKASGDGLHVAKRTRQSLSVVVRFCIYEYSVTRRKAVMQQIVAWAKAGKYLSINDRPDQRLRVEVDELPTIASAMKWTQELSVTFTAYAMPYWEDEEATTVSVANGGTSSVYVPGDADRAVVNATITPTATTVTVQAGNTSITLEGVTKAVEISHGDDGILRIVSGGEGIMAARAPESDDELTVTPGATNDFGVSGGTAVFSVRGVWA